MTEPYGYDEDNGQDDDGQDDRHVRLTRDQIRTLERDAKQARKANEELAQMKRELALTRAGLGDLSPARQKALLANIDGDITADAARAAATELGFIDAPPADDDAAALDRMSNASAGASDSAAEDSVARLHRAAAEGGQAALLAQIQADGHSIVNAG